MRSHAASAPSSSSLADRIETLTRDLDWTLAHFPFVACVTALKAECDVAHSPSMSVASAYSSTQPRLAFVGESADLLAMYATFLIDTGGEVELLVNAAQREVARAAFAARTVEPLWQMVFRGKAGAPDSSHVIELTGTDLPAMRALAESTGAELRFMARGPFAQGPSFGIWEGKKLVALGTTDVCLRNAAQIGNVIAHGETRGRELRAEITAALVKTHSSQGRTVFLVIAQDDETAIRLFEDIGFVRERPLYRMRCVLK